MSTFKSLSKEAHEAARWRGHTMTRFRRVDSREIWVSTCVHCGKHTILDLYPAPNGIEIHGEAVALGCSQ